MSPRQARDFLPDVPVRIGNTLHTGRVTGRQNACATVTVSGQWSHALQAPWLDAQFSWEAVARAATTGNPLVF